MIGSELPAAACQDPSVRRKSWMRRSASPDRSRSRSQASFGSTRWPRLPCEGKTYWLAAYVFRRR